MAAMHQCWVIAGLSDLQKTHRCNSRDKQGLFQLALQSSTDADGMHSVLGVAAVSGAG